MVNKSMKQIPTSHRYMQGQFKPMHPEKYRGNPAQIIYRSSWELAVLMRLDSNKNVIEWASEEFRENGNDVESHWGLSYRNTQCMGQLQGIRLHVNRSR